MPDPQSTNRAPKQEPAPSQPTYPPEPLTPAAAVLTAGTVAGVLAAAPAATGPILAKDLVAGTGEQVASTIAKWGARRLRKRRDADLITVLDQHKDGGIAASDLSKAVASEERIEQIFQAGTRARVARDMQAALEIADPEARKRQIKAILDRERRYARAHEMAAKRRLEGAADAALVRKVSPDGAYWMLSVRPIQHCEVCKALAGQVWPWDVLLLIHPPQHPNCGCRLISTDSAISAGLATTSDVPSSPQARKRRTADAVRLYRQAVSVGHSQHYPDALDELTEARVRRPHLPNILRFKKGLVKGGQFAPKRGGVSAATRGKLDTGTTVRGGRTDGRWQQIEGRSVFVPRGRRFVRRVNGHEYTSEKGTTAVLKDGEPLPERWDADAIPQGSLELPTIRLTDTDADGLRRRIGALRERKAPRGQYPKDGGTLSGHSPESIDEYAQDGMDLSRFLADRFRTDTRINSVKVDRRFGDHSGIVDFEGDIKVGQDVPIAIALDAQARNGGTPLTDHGKSLVFGNYKVLAHEVAHTVRPMAGLQYVVLENRALEEALTEEVAHVIAVENMRRHGRTDLIEWVRANPENEYVRGSYPEYRTRLLHTLNAVGVAPEEREDIIMHLKFREAPDQRFMWLAHLAEQNGRDLDENQIRELMLGKDIDTVGGDPDTVDESFTGPILAPHWQDIPAQAPSVQVLGETITVGSTVKWGHDRESRVEAIQDGVLKAGNAWIHPEQVSAVTAIGSRAIAINGHDYLPGDEFEYRSGGAWHPAKLVNTYNLKDGEGGTIEAVGEFGQPFILHPDSHDIRPTVPNTPENEPTEVWVPDPTPTPQVRRTPPADNAQVASVTPPHTLSTPTPANPPVASHALRAAARRNRRTPTARQIKHDTELLNTATVAIRTDPRALQGILTDGHVKNWHEAGTTNGHFVPLTRAYLEASTFTNAELGDPAERAATAYDRQTAAAQLDPASFPIYGYMDGTGRDPIEYGPIKLKLKDTARARTTYTAEPMLDTSYEQSAAPSLLASPDPTLSGVIGRDAAEAQIHGGVTLADIDSIEVPPDTPKSLRDALDRSGIPWAVNDKVPVGAGKPRPVSGKGRRQPAHAMEFEQFAAQAWNDPTGPHRRPARSSRDPRTFSHGSRVATGRPDVDSLFEQFAREHGPADRNADSWQEAKRTAHALADFLTVRGVQARVTVDDAATFSPGGDRTLGQVRDRHATVEVLDADGVSVIDFSPARFGRGMSHPPVPPADYRGAHTAPGPEFGARMFELDADMFPADVYTHPEFYAHGEPDMESWRVAAAVRGDPDAPVTVYRAAPVGVLHDGDWVTPSREYARVHGLDASDPDKDMPVWAYRVPAASLWTDANSLSEYGFAGPTLKARERHDADGSHLLAPDDSPEARQWLGAWQRKRFADELASGSVPERPGFDRFDSEDEWLETGREAHDAQQTWIREVARAVSRGQVTEQQALDADWRLTRSERFAPVPPTVYHATSALDAVRAHGLLAGDERDGEQNVGLGGQSDGAISVTTDRQIADDITTALVELRDVLAGDITLAEMLAAADRGDGADRPFADDVRDSLFGHGGALTDHWEQTFEGRRIVTNPLMRVDGTDLPATAENLRAHGLEPFGAATENGVYGRATRERTPDERRASIVEFMLAFRRAREAAGGRPDPVIVFANYEALGRTPRDQFGTLEVAVKDNTFGQAFGELGEFRVFAGDTLRPVADLTHGQRWDGMFDPGREPVQVAGWRADRLPARPVRDRFADGGDFHQAELDWERAVTREVSRGTVTVEEAQDAGWSASGQVFESVPHRTMFHATTGRDAVRREGLLTPSERGPGTEPSGLGGAHDAISLTYSREAAENANAALIELRDVLAGVVSLRDMLARADRGDGADRPFGGDVRRRLFGRDAALADEWEAKLDGMALDPSSPTGLRPLSTDLRGSMTEAHGAVVDFMRAYRTARERAGGTPDPIIVGTDYGRLAAIPRDQFAVLEVKVADGAFGVHVPGEQEWRLFAGSTTKVARDLTAGQDWGDSEGVPAYMPDPGVDLTLPERRLHPVPSLEDAEPGDQGSLLGPPEKPFERSPASRFVRNLERVSLGSGSGDDRTVFVGDYDGRRVIVDDPWGPGWADDADPDEHDWEVEDAEDFVWKLSDIDLEDMYPPVDEWEAVPERPGYLMLHGTDPGNVESILANGLEAGSPHARDNDAWGVWVTESEGTASAYGDATIVVDLGAMKADGVLPELTRDKGIREGEMRNAVAQALGLHDFVDESAALGGYTEDTLVIDGSVDPKYLSVYDPPEGRYDLGAALRRIAPMREATVEPRGGAPVDLRQGVRYLAKLHDEASPVEVQWTGGMDGDVPVVQPIASRDRRDIRLDTNNTDWLRPVDDRSPWRLRDRVHPSMRSRLDGFAASFDAGEWERAAREAQAAIDSTGEADDAASVQLRFVATEARDWANSRIGSPPRITTPEPVIEAHRNRPTGFVSVVDAALDPEAWGGDDSLRATGLDRRALLNNTPIHLFRAVRRGRDTAILPGDYVTADEAYARRYGDEQLGGDYTLDRVLLHPVDLEWLGDPTEFRFVPVDAEAAYAAMTEKAYADGHLAVRPADDSGQQVPVTANGRVFRAFVGDDGQWFASREDADMAAAGSDRVLARAEEMAAEDVPVGEGELSVAFGQPPSAHELSARGMTPGIPADGRRGDGQQGFRTARRRRRRREAVSRALSEQTGPVASRDVDAYLGAHRTETGVVDGQLADGQVRVAAVNGIAADDRSAHLVSIPAGTTGPLRVFERPGPVPVAGEITRRGVPARLFHVTADGEQVRRDGIVRATDGGELGGRVPDNAAVFTTDERLARQAATDLQTLARAAQDGDVDRALAEFEDRERSGGAPAPAFANAADIAERVDPERVEVIEVSAASLPKKALITESGDTVLVHGDVKLGTFDTGDSFAGRHSEAHATAALLSAPDDDLWLAATQGDNRMRQMARAALRGRDMSRFADTIASRPEPPTASERAVLEDWANAVGMAPRDRRRVLGDTATPDWPNGSLGAALDRSPLADGERVAFERGAAFWPVQVDGRDMQVVGAGDEFVMRDPGVGTLTKLPVAEALALIDEHRLRPSPSRRDFDDRGGSEPSERVYGTLTAETLGLGAVNDRDKVKRMMDRIRSGEQPFEDGTDSEDLRTLLAAGAFLVTNFEFEDSDPNDSLKVRLLLLLQSFEGDSIPMPSRMSLRSMPGAEMDVTIADGKVTVERWKPGLYGTGEPVTVEALTTTAGWREALLQRAAQIADEHGKADAVRGLGGATPEGYAGSFGPDGVLSVESKVFVPLAEVAFRVASGREVDRELALDAFHSLETLQHEIGHGVNPISPTEYHGWSMSLLEALQEETAPTLAIEWARDLGLGEAILPHVQAAIDAANDGGAWDMRVRGVYMGERQALGHLMESIPDDERRDLLMRWKYEVPLNLALAELADRAGIDPDEAQELLKQPAPFESEEALATLRPVLPLATGVPAADRPEWVPALQRGSEVGLEPGRLVYADGVLGRVVAFDADDNAVVVEHQNGTVAYRPEFVDMIGAASSNGEIIGDWAGSGKVFVSRSGPSRAIRPGRRAGDEPLYRGLGGRESRPLVRADLLPAGTGVQVRETFYGRDDAVIERDDDGKLWAVPVATPWLSRRRLRDDSFVERSEGFRIGTRASDLRAGDRFVNFDVDSPGGVVEVAKGDGTDTEYPWVWFIHPQEIDATELRLGDLFTENDDAFGGDDDGAVSEVSGLRRSGRDVVYEGSRWQDGSPVPLVAGMKVHRVGVPQTAQVPDGSLVMFDPGVAQRQVRFVAGDDLREGDQVLLPGFEEILTAERVENASTLYAGGFRLIPRQVYMVPGKEVNPAAVPLSSLDRGEGFAVGDGTGVFLSSHPSPRRRATVEFKGSRLTLPEGIDPLVVPTGREGYSAGSLPDGARVRLIGSGEGVLRRHNAGLNFDPDHGGIEPLLETTLVLPLEPVPLTDAPPLGDPRQAVPLDTPIEARLLEPGDLVVIDDEVMRFEKASPNLEYVEFSTPSRDWPVQYGASTPISRVMPESLTRLTGANFPQPHSTSARASWLVRVADIPDGGKFRLSANGPEFTMVNRAERVVSSAEYGLVTLDADDMSRLPVRLSRGSGQLDGQQGVHWVERGEASVQELLPGERFVLRRPEPDEDLQLFERTDDGFMLVDPEFGLIRPLPSMLKQAEDDPFVAGLLTAEASRLTAVRWRETEDARQSADAVDIADADQPSWGDLPLESRVLVDGFVNEDGEREPPGWWEVEQIAVDEIRAFRVDDPSRVETFEPGLLVDTVDRTTFDSLVQNELIEDPGDPFGPSELQAVRDGLGERGERVWDALATGGEWEATHDGTRIWADGDTLCVELKNGSEQWFDSASAAIETALSDAGAEKEVGAQELVEIFDGFEHDGLNIVVEQARRGSIEAVVYEGDHLVGRLERSVLDNGAGSVTVSHDLMSMDSEVQGRGFGKALMEHQIREYQARGWDRVKVSASMSVGGYAWARLGFEPSSFGALIEPQRQQMNNLRTSGMTDAEIAAEVSELRDLVNDGTITSISDVAAYGVDRGWLMPASLPFQIRRSLDPDHPDDWDLQITVDGNPLYERHATEEDALAAVDRIQRENGELMWIGKALLLRRTWAGEIDLHDDVIGRIRAVDERIEAGKKKIREGETRVQPLFPLPAQQDVFAPTPNALAPPGQDLSRRLPVGMLAGGDEFMALPDSPIAGKGPFLVTTEDGVVVYQDQDGKRFGLAAGFEVAPIRDTYRYLRREALLNGTATDAPPRPDPLWGEGVTNPNLMPKRESRDPLTVRAAEMLPGDNFEGSRIGITGDYGLDQVVRIEGGVIVGERGRYEKVQPIGAALEALRGATLETTFSDVREGEAFEWNGVSLRRVGGLMIDEEGVNYLGVIPRDAPVRVPGFKFGAGYRGGDRIAARDLHPGDMFWGPGDRHARIFTGGRSARNHEAWVDWDNATVVRARVSAQPEGTERMRFGDLDEGQEFMFAAGGDTYRDRPFIKRGNMALRGPEEAERLDDQTMIFAFPNDRESLARRMNIPILLSSPPVVERAPVRGLSQDGEPITSWLGQADTRVWVGPESANLALSYMPDTLDEVRSDSVREGAIVYLPHAHIKGEALVRVVNVREDGSWDVTNLSRPGQPPYIIAPEMLVQVAPERAVFEPFTRDIEADLKENVRVGDQVRVNQVMMRVASIDEDGTWRMVDANGRNRGMFSKRFPVVPRLQRLRLDGTAFVMSDDLTVGDTVVRTEGAGTYRQRSVVYEVTGEDADGFTITPRDPRASEVLLLERGQRVEVSLETANRIELAELAALGESQFV